MFGANRENLKLQRELEASNRELEEARQKNIKLNNNYDQLDNRYRKLVLSDARAINLILNIKAQLSRNTYNNEKIKNNKIRELIHSWQSGK